MELGIDAFALNIGLDSWESASVANAYQVAQNVAMITGKVFKLFISFDLSFTFMADQINTYIESYATHPNQFKYQNAAFVSTFSGKGTTLEKVILMTGGNYKSKMSLLRKESVSTLFPNEVPLIRTGFSRSTLLWTAYSVGTLGKSHTI